MSLLPRARREYVQNSGQPELSPMPSVNCDPAVTASVAMVTGLSLLTEEGLRHPVKGATSRSASRPRLKVRGGLYKFHQPPV